MSSQTPRCGDVARFAFALSFTAVSFGAPIQSAHAARTPIFAVTPASLSLSAPLSGTSAAKKFTVTNTGRRDGTATAALTSSEFLVTPASCRLKQKASCTMSVQFAPTGTIVTRTAQLTINGGADAAPVVALSGVVLYAVFSVFPTSLSLATAVKTAAATKTITVTNTGSFAGIPGVQVTGVGGAQFPVSNGCTSSVNSKGTCILTVGFTPTSSGTKSATIAVTGTSGKQTVALSGTIVTSKSQGQWSSWNYDNDQTGIYPWPNVAIHLHVLRDGNLLSIARGGTDSTSKTFVVPIPANGVPGLAVEVDNANTNMFCSGHTFLPDGRLFVAGGHQTGDHDGSRNSNTFEYGPYSWHQGTPMHLGRWYPTATGLANGDVLVVGGDMLANGQIVRNLVPEVWNRTNGTWTQLSGASLSVPLFSPMHLAPNGTVFMSGTDAQSRFLDTSGTGHWIMGPLRQYTGSRDYGSSVLLEDSRVLVMGGGQPTATSEIIDLKSASPTWAWTKNSMAFARRQMNATLLPDGAVLVTGGTSSSTFNDGTNAVYAAEIWDPDTGLWSTMASAKIKRLYHSTALLLPDGRVLSGGGGQPPPSNGTGSDNYNVEIYSPPYLFTGVRPTIQTSPTSLTYDTTFQVTTDAADITTVSLVRLGSVTHTFDMSQRIKFLNFTASARPSGGSTLNIATPLSTQKTLVPPGYYMLFVINSNGAPSVAKIVQLL